MEKQLLSAILNGNQLFVIVCEGGFKLSKMALNKRKFLKAQIYFFEVLAYIQTWQKLTKQNCQKLAQVCKSTKKPSLTKI